MNTKSRYQELKPKEELQDLVHSFWTHENLTNSPQVLQIFPDSFFKIVIIYQEGEIRNYLLTGIWSEPKEFSILPNASSFGCRFKILAPEYLLGREIASLYNSAIPLEQSYLNIGSFDYASLSTVVERWQAELLKIRPLKAMDQRKRDLSDLLYQKKGDITVSEVSDKISWSERQINRYLGKHVGPSLKKYLNIQKCYRSYFRIRDGQFFPEENYFDQPHFIREVRKHTGETPTSLFENQNDRFIQLKNMREE